MKRGQLWPPSRQRNRSQSGSCVVWFWASTPGHISSLLFCNLTLPSNSRSIFEQRTFDFLSLWCLFHAIPFALSVISAFFLCWTSVLTVRPFLSVTSCENLSSSGSFSLLSRSTAWHACLQSNAARLKSELYLSSELWALGRLSSTLFNLCIPRTCHVGIKRLRTVHWIIKNL